MADSGTFTFMAGESLSSLYRNGRVLIDRDPRGNTGDSKGIDVDHRTMVVHDARQPEVSMTCDENGFEICEHPLTAPVSFLDHDDVIRNYYPQCEQLVAKATGARAFAFDHNVRSASGKEGNRAIEGGQDVQGPAHMVHGDYTLWGAPERLAQLSQPPGGNDTLKGYLPEGESLISADLAAAARQDGGRFAIINVWRNIADEPVARHPMALCDGQTIRPEDLVVFEIHYPNRIGENYFSKFADQQKYYYYPELSGDEALLIKQWDSAGRLAMTDGAEGDRPGEPCTFSFHTAFHPDGLRDDAPDRWSIEVRCMVIYR